MDLGLQNKIALVAASSRGLGKAAALALAQEGCDVIITARGQEALDRTADEIRAATGRQVLAIPADVSVVADIDRLVDAAMSAFGRVDILVNNAGGPRPGVFTDMDDEDWLAAIDLNLMSAIRLTERLLPGMRQRGWGRIINITSISVKQPLPNLILSNTARAGVVAMAKTLAGQVAAEGITVNNVCPGYTLTDRVRSIAENRAQDEDRSAQAIIEEMAEDVPARRLGQPEELAALIAFLASQRAAYITGTTIQCDGGYVASLL
jgi:3-oxoacyl-[acyl-carrier protein] reductase